MDSIELSLHKFRREGSDPDAELLLLFFFPTMQPPRYVSCMGTTLCGEQRGLKVRSRFVILESISSVMALGSSSYISCCVVFT